MHAVIKQMLMLLGLSFEVNCRIAEFLFCSTARRNHDGENGGCHPAGVTRTRTTLLREWDGRSGWNLGSTRIQSKQCSCLYKYYAAIFFPPASIWLVCCISTQHVWRPVLHYLIFLLSCKHLTFLALTDRSAIPSKADRVCQTGQCECVCVFLRRYPSVFLTVGTVRPKERLHGLAEKPGVLKHQ